MSSLKRYFKLSKPTASNGRRSEQTPLNASKSTLPLGSQSEKDLADWPPQLERTRADSVVDDSSSFYVDTEPSGTTNSDADSFVNLKSEVIVNWLYQKQQEKIWTTGGLGEGVVLRKAKGRYVCCPSTLQYDESNLYQMVARLNVCVCRHILRPKTSC